MGDENVSPDAWKEKTYTLIFCFSTGQDGKKRILLGMKKRGFGMMKYNGFGGKIEEGETTEEGAKRELEEESTLVANKLINRGYLVFNMHDSRKIMKVHVYSCDEDNYTGTPTETEEMRPQWFNIDSVPFEKMWLDDKYWLPYLLDADKNPDNKSILGRFDYSDEETIDDFDVRLV